MLVLLSLGFSQANASPRKLPSQSERCWWLWRIVVSSSGAGASIHPSHGSWNRKPLSWGKVSLSERTMNTSTKRKLWIGGGLGLAVIGVTIGAMRPKHVSGAQPGGAPDVEVVQVEQKDVPIFGEWIGTLDGFTNADVRAQVSGYLQRQGYQEGAFVRKGQLLFEIDPRPFQAALDQAEGQLAQAN